MRRLRQLWFTILVSVSGLQACTKSDSGAQKAAVSSDRSSGAKATGDSVVVVGQLAVGDLGSETVGPSGLRLSQRDVEVKDAAGNTVSKAVTGTDGSYVAAIPGTIAVASSSLALGDAGLSIQAVISDTADKNVVGTQQKLKLTSSRIDLGPTPLSKITAIRGTATMDGARDHTGIVVYIPGTNIPAARTDASGGFVMTFIAPGTYNLRFEKDGYQPVSATGIKVTNGQTTMVSAAQLTLSGGTGKFFVKQIGTEGTSRSRKVEFTIGRGDADRMRAGPIETVETMSYSKPPEVYSIDFPSDGLKTLKFIFATADGFESSVIREVLVDTVPPSATGMKLADVVTLNASFARTRSVVAYHPNCTDIDRVAILPASATAPVESDFKWSCTATVNGDSLFDLPSGGAAYDYRLWVEDIAGNRSASFASGSIKVDSVPPVPPAFALIDATSSGTGASNATGVYLRINDCGDTALVVYAERQTSQPKSSEFVRPCSTTPSALPYTFETNTEETKTVRLWAMDAAGNISDFSVAASTVLDRTPPNPVGFTIASSQPYTAGFSRVTSLLATPSSCTDVAAVLFGDNLTTAPAELAAGWQTCSTSTAVAVTASGTGNRTIYGWSKDLAGNISTTAANAFINVNTTPPAVASLNFNLADSTTFSSSLTNALAVTAQFSNCGGVDKVYLTDNSATTPVAADFTISCFNGSAALTLSAGSDGVRTAYLWGRDAAGNVSAAAKSTTINLDRVTGPTLTPSTLTPKLTHNTARFVFSTNESSTSAIDFGTTTAYGASGSPTSDSSPSTNHDLTLTGLSSDTTYYYRVTSTDSLNNSTITTGSFKTFIGKLGHLTANETWSDQTNTYYIAGNLFVDTGVTLTIQQGVTIKIKQSMGIQIDGTLVARGTSGSLILFTSAAEFPAAGDWGYINFSASSGDTTTDAAFPAGNYTGGNIIEYATLEYGGGGGSAYDSYTRGMIKGDNSKFAVLNSTLRNALSYDIMLSGGYTGNLSGLILRNSVLTSSYGGVSVGACTGACTGTQNSAAIDISNNEISSHLFANYSTGDGIDIINGAWNGTVSISGNTIKSNPNYGIKLQNVGTGSGSPLVLTRNIVQSNASAYGARGISGLYVAGSVTRNLIIDNTNAIEPIELFINSSGTTTVQNNVICGNAGGLYLASQVSGVTAAVANNQFCRNTVGNYDNASAIIAASSTGSNTFNYTANTFSANGATYTVSLPTDTGITHTFLNNTFYSNTSSYLINNQRTSGASPGAASNYWGSTNASVIDALIYDQTENIARTSVNMATPLANPAGAAPMAVPANVTATAATSGTINVSWNSNPETNVAQYKVYYNTADSRYPYTGGSITVAPVGGATQSAQLSGLTPGQNYFIVVTARNTTSVGADDITDGKESWYSAPVAQTSP